ncbi:MAG: PAS domain S-box protein [Syntrophobacteraceae bacterium]
MTDEEKTRERPIGELREPRRSLSATAPSNNSTGGDAGNARRYVAKSGPPADEADFRRLFENSLDAILLTTADGTVTAANPAACAMFGMTEEEFVRAGRKESIYPAGPVDAGGPKQRACSGKIECELSRVRGNRAKFPAEVSSVVLAGGRKALIIVRDISGRKRAKKRPSPAYASLSQTLESITDGFSFLDREWRFTYLNQTGAEAFGRKTEDLTGRVIWDLFPNAAETRLYAEARRAANTGIPVHLEEFYPEPLNAWFEWHAYPSLEGLSLCYRDITSRKLIQEANSTLAAIVESSDDAIIGKSLDGQILTWNRGAERIYGYTVEEAIGRNISILVPEDRPDEVPAILDRIRRDEIIDHYEAVRQTKDGRQIHISLTVSPIQDASGKIIGASSIARDITERKLMEEELRRAYEELEMKVLQRTRELAEKSTHLEEINTALRVLLKQREDDRKEFGESILINVRNLVAPYIERLKGGNLSRAHATLVEIIESHLNEITSSFSRTLAMRHAALTPTEMRVAAFIKDGRPTVEIAEILCISDKTVACHRANVRKKLGLQGGRNNLRSFLMSIS